MNKSGPKVPKCGMGENCGRVPTYSRDGKPMNQPKWEEDQAGKGRREENGAWKPLHCPSQSIAVAHFPKSQADNSCMLPRTESESVQMRKGFVLDSYSFSSQLQQLLKAEGIEKAPTATQ